MDFATTAKCFVPESELRNAEITLTFGFVI